MAPWSHFSEPSQLGKPRKLTYSQGLVFLDEHFFALLSDGREHRNNNGQKGEAKKRAADYNYKPGVAAGMFDAMDKQEASMGAAAPASAEGRAASKASKAGARDFAKQ
jgi:hypothetical protein